MKQASSENQVEHGVHDARIQKAEVGRSGVLCQPGQPTETLTQNPEAARNSTNTEIEAEPWNGQGSGFSPSMKQEKKTESRAAVTACLQWECSQS